MSGKLTKEAYVKPAPTKAFSELTSLSAALLIGNHLGPLHEICEGQSSISTNKLQKLASDLEEYDRKLAVALLGIRDQLSPDDKKTWEVQIREIAELTDGLWCVAPILTSDGDAFACFESVDCLNTNYVGKTPTEAVQAAYTAAFSDARGDSE